MQAGKEGTHSKGCPENIIKFLRAFNTPVNKNPKKTTITNFIPQTLKYWFGVQQGQSYLMGRRCPFSLG